MEERLTDSASRNLWDLWKAEEDQCVFQSYIVHRES